MKAMIKVGMVALIVFAASLVLFSADAWATSQWGKKYGLSCMHCHTLFPRLNYVGEKFMRDGYQFNQDGNDNKQEVNSRLFLDELKNLFGIRLNVRAAEYRTNGIVRNGEARPRLTFGDTAWVQFFVAGSIYKNVSIFIENEISDSGKAKFKWFKLGFHNLFGSAVNMVIGQQAPMEWMPNSGRLRVIPDGESMAWGPTSSNSGLLAEESTGLNGDRQAISFYGAVGPMVYFGGVSPGFTGDNSGAGDVSEEVAYWLGGRFEVIDGPMQGSALGLMAMMGTDTSNTALGKQNENEYNRYSVQALLRQGGAEFSANYTFGDDDNVNLLNKAQEQAAKAAGVNVEQEFSTFFIQAAYQFGADKEYYAAVRYADQDMDNDELQGMFSGDGKELGLSFFYTPMENLKIGWTSIIDMEERDNVKYKGVTFPNTSHKGDIRQNIHHITIRTMF